MRHGRRVLLVLLLAGACSGGRSGAKPAKPTLVREPAQDGPKREATSATASSEPEQVPPPQLRINIAGDTHSGLSVSLQNRDAKNVQVSSRLRVERSSLEGKKGSLSGDTAPKAATLELRSECGTTLPPCVELTPGAELLPPTLQSLQEGSQCGCPGCPKLPAGRYRVVAQGCDSEFSLASDPIVVAGPEQPTEGPHQSDK